MTITNDKYDLHDIEYSVQGWDAILATDMQAINDNLTARILGILGETVLAYKALYLKPSDHVWWKAQADGVKQPCLGIAVEGGIVTNEIRIHRMGEITNAAWTWAILGGPIYLDASTAGEMTQTKPAVPNPQIVGYAISATKMLAVIVPNLPYIGAIKVDTTGVGNVGAGEDVLMTYSLPANALNANGKAIRVTVYGTIVNNANAKTVKVYFGTTVVYSGAMTANQAYKWCAQFTAVRTGLNTQDVFGTGFVENVAIKVAPYYATDTQTETSTITIKCTGEGVANNDITQEGMIVEYIN